MSHRISLAFALAALFTVSLASPVQAAPRVSAAFTTWDALYFYAGFNVTDSNVVSTNDDLTSQPQQDDNIEVYFETDGARHATSRTPKTFQMSVSAAGGAYFSVGDGSKIPAARAIYDYKFDTNVDGTMNDPKDTDRGYTVEVAIPWSELGLIAPPQAGTVWGFNVISRDRDSMTAPATKFFSLSPLVKTRDDVQDPSKWSQITFANDPAGATSTVENVVCARVSASYPPVVDGVLRSGEYPTSTAFAFGNAAIAGAAPTLQEEPNVNGNAVTAPTAPTPAPGPVAQPQGPGVTLTPAPGTQPTPATAPTNPTPGTETSATQNSSSPPDYNIYLPSGGIIRVGPPTAATTNAPPILTPTVPTTPSGPSNPGTPSRPKFGKEPIVISPDVPVPATDVAVPDAPTINTSIPAPLLPQSRPSSRLMATYVLDQPASPAIDSYFDQPADGLGTWFGGMRGQYVADQLRNSRISGVEVLLPVFSGTKDQIAGLRSLVQGLKLAEGNGEDYPLLGLRLPKTDDDYATIATFFSNVPPQYRAEVNLGDADANRRAYVVVADHAVDIPGITAKFERNFAGKDTLAISVPGDASQIKTAIVTPGGLANGVLTGRQQAHTYETSWAAAVSSGPDWIVVDSWNDFAKGNEIAISRQYSDQYANLTRVYAVTWQGQKPWSAEFLQSDVPTQIAPKTLYEVHVRVENSGMLPWLKSQSYALSYRWYSKEGKLIDDSAPHITFADDILPGASANVTVGLVAQNSYRTAIDPGDYYLVFDVVQGQHQWFSYTGNQPLKLPVTVLGANDVAPDRLTFLSTNMPQFVKPGQTYYVTAKLRNDGSKTWTSGDTALVYTMTVNDGTPSTPVSTALSADVSPGGVAVVSLPMQIPAKAASNVVIAWRLEKPDYKGGYTERLSVAPTDPGAIFLLTDLSRHLKTGDKPTVSVSVFNGSPQTWKKSDYKVSYRWFYLDGTPAGASETLPAPLPGDVVPGQEVAVVTQVKAPEYPGRYNLVWDLVQPDGTFVGDVETISKPRGLLALQVWVVGDKNANTVPVDLKAAFNTRGVAFEGEQTTGFDGNGAAIPGEMLPPDGSYEIDGNPFLIGKAGPSLYPSGYYSATSGTEWGSSHRISFLFPGKRDNNVVEARGQVIDLPDGDFRSIHILAAAASDTPVDTEIVAQYKGSTASAHVSIAPWTAKPTGDATVGFRAPYRLVKSAPDNSKPCILGDYTIVTVPGKKLTGLALPNNPKIKILAITLEK